jgi:cation transport protein ChaC
VLPLPRKNKAIEIMSNVSPIPDHLPKSSDGNDLWVFAYASLMWRPDFEHTEVCDAILHGYHRRLCLYSFQYRGTPECPGLVFGLDKGGSCRGRVLRVAAKNVDDVVTYLYEREMINGVYNPTMASTLIKPADGPPIKAVSLAFIADREHQQYTGPLQNDEAVRLIRQGKGKGGPCIDYLTNTARHLRELGLVDHHLEKLIKLSLQE